MYAASSESCLAGSEISETPTGPAGGVTEGKLAMALPMGAFSRGCRLFNIQQATRWQEALGSLHNALCLSERTCEARLPTGLEGGHGSQ